MQDPEKYNPEEQISDKDKFPTVQFQEKASEIIASHIHFRRSVIGLPNEMNPRIYTDESLPGFYIAPVNFYPRNLLYFMLLHAHFGVNNLKETASQIEPILREMKKDWMSMKKLTEKAEFTLGNYLWDIQ